MAQTDDGCGKREDAEMNLNQADAEAFLFHESALLDSWKLKEWAGLFTDDGVYLVPPLDQPEGMQRALRLLKANAHAEFPRSKTRRLISNVRVTNTGGDVAHVAANFVVYRSRLDTLDCFPGHAEYEVVVRANDELAFRSKRAVLDLDTLRPHGKLSIIL
jgi:p-cumate 2,3-dioxygenase beta subunit